LPRMDEAWELEDVRWVPMGRDMLLEGYVPRGSWVANEWIERAASATGA
jgi:hypothetical protein